MTKPAIPWVRALQLAERGYARWAEKPHNRKWARRIDGTPIRNDLLVNIANAVCEGLPEVDMDEKQARIFQLERRIHNQRVQLHDTWEIMEDRASQRRAWWPHPLLRAILQRRKPPPPWWRRLALRLSH